MFAWYLLLRLASCNRSRLLLLVDLDAARVEALELAGQVAGAYAVVGHRVRKSLALAVEYSPASCRRKFEGTMVRYKEYTQQNKIIKTKNSS